MHIENKSRSILKSASYRVFGTLTTGAIAFAVSGKASVAFAIGGLDAFSKVVVYFFHERLWNKIQFGRREVKPVVIWLTGLSGAGKTTVAIEIIQRLKTQGFKVEHLDGDLVRELFPETGFSKEARDQHVRRIGHLASRLEKHGVFVVASLVSPYDESRKFVRGLCKNFVEVHVSTPLDVCERRDAKGLYKKAREGLIKNFTGIDDPYEIPLNPELRIDGSLLGVSEAATQVISSLDFS